MGGICSVMWESYFTVVKQNVRWWILFYLHTSCFTTVKLSSSGFKAFYWNIISKVVWPLSTLSNTGHYHMHSFISEEHSPISYHHHFIITYIKSLFWLNLTQIITFPTLDKQTRVAGFDCNNLSLFWGLMSMLRTG